MNIYQTGNQTSHQKCRCKMLRENKSESRILFQPPYVSIARVKKKKRLLQTFKEPSETLKEMKKRFINKTNLEGSAEVKETKVSKFRNKTH